jgi:hypothetical protein
MRKIVLTLFIITFHQLLFSQEINDRLSFEFKDVNRMSVIQTIETSTTYKFYFDPEWIDTDKSLISGSYNNVSIETLLEKIFDKTNLNFYILKNSIILTNNSIIYDKLAANYFHSPTEDNQSKELDKATENPIFYQQYDTVNDSKSKNSSAITFIGKESKTASKSVSTISGHIKNAITGKYEPNIALKIRNKNISTITDNNGYYKLQVPSGINILETKSLIHKKIIRTIMVYDNGKLDLEVYDNLNLLDDVIINSSGQKKVEAVISGVIAIDIEIIKNIPLVLGERDIFKVASTLPGIKTAGEGSAGFNVRGGKADQNLILLDNAVLYNPQHFLGFFSAVNPYTTSRATIYKGSIPAEFGGRLSSVFDVTTKSASTEKLTGEGGLGPVMSNIAIGTPIVKGKSSLLVGARATYSGWILRSLDEESLKNSQASFYDVTIKYDHKLNKNNSIESTFYYSHDAFSITSDSLYKYKNRLVSLEWDHSFNEKNKAALIITNSDYKFNIDYDTEQINAFDFGYKINETQVLLNLNYGFSYKHKFNYGVSSKLYNINPGFLDPKNSESLLTAINIEQEKALESAVYLSDNFKVNEKLSIDMGLRYSLYTSLGESTQRIYEANTPKSDATVIEVKTFGSNKFIKTYGGLEPRLAVRYLLTDDFSVKTSYDKTYQYIHLLSSNTTQSPTDTWKLSDLNVKPQMAEQYSLGFYKNLHDDVLELSAEGYYKKSKNILDYKVGAELLLNENIETELLQGEGKAYGVELLLKKESGRLNGWLGYTYSRAFTKLDSQFNDEKINNGEYFSSNFDKPHDINAVLNYKFTKRYSMSTNFVYQTGRPITYPTGTYTYGNAEYTLYSDRNKFRIPDYYRLDIGINIEGTHKTKKLAHGFWNLSIYNVLGRNNPYSVYFITTDGQIKAYKTSVFSIPVPTITYNFKF